MEMQKLKDWWYLKTRKWRWPKKRYVYSDRYYEAFKERETTETQVLRRQLYNNGVDGWTVIEVGNICWGVFLHPVTARVLVAVKYLDGVVGLVQYDGTSCKRVTQGSYAWLLDNINEVPDITVYDDEYQVHYGNGHYAVAKSKFPSNDFVVCGTGCIIGNEHEEVARSA